jgi:hypothetical protein
VSARRVAKLSLKRGPLAADAAVVNPLIILLAIIVVGSGVLWAVRRRDRKGHAEPGRPMSTGRGRAGSVL